MRKKTGFIQSLALFVLFLVVIAGCVTPPSSTPYTPPPPPPQILASEWGNNYYYSYNPPVTDKRSPASVPATIVVVNPIYKVEESSLREKLYSKVGKGFSASMGIDLERVIVTKGMTVKGPYASLDEITYSDKKSSDLVLLPRIFVTSQVQYDDNLNKAGEWTYEGKKIFANVKTFEMKTSGWIAFLMKEPLSKETMWIKKLELDEVTMTGEVYYEAIPIYEEIHIPPTFWNSGYYEDQITGYKKGNKVFYDGRQDAMANTLKKIYLTAMQKIWIYIDADEVIDLKQKVKEIRELKRY